MGTPKQLLAYEGKTLLQHSLQVAVDSLAHPVIVVLGDHADDIKRETDLNSVHAVVNAGWQEGMASSIRLGIKTLLEIDPHTGGAVLMLCDQPFVTSALLNDLIAAHQNTGKAIVASSYSNTLGVPAFFHKSICCTVHIHPENEQVYTSALRNAWYLVYHIPYNIRRCHSHDLQQQRRNVSETVHPR